MPAACRIRRRGEAVRAAVLEATKAEITEAGLGRISVDRIAARAGTGKAAVYRRWPNVQALVLDVVVAEMHKLMPTGRPSTGRLRDDLVREYAGFAAALDGPTGTVLVEFISEGIRDPGLLSDLQATTGKARRDEILRLVQEAVDRGEIPAQDIDPYVVEVAPALVVSQLVTTGSAPSRADVGRIVDSVVLPLLRYSAVLQPA